MYENGYIGPEGKPDVKQGEAPGGLWPTAELPVKDVDSVPMTTGGYTPSPMQQPLPPPGSTVGDGLPPGGSRR